MPPSPHTPNRYFPLGVAVSLAARRDLELSPDTLAPPPGRTLFALRQLAAALARRQSLAGPVSAVRLQLLALLGTAQRSLIGHYLAARTVRLDGEALIQGPRRESLPDWPAVLATFTRLFPAAGPAGAGHRDPGPLPELAMTELLVLATQTANPAARPFWPLFATDELDRTCPWRGLVAALDVRLARQEGAGLLAGSLLELLAGPVRAAPDSLEEQVGFVRRNWAEFLPAELLARFATAFALLAEEQQVRGAGPGPAPVPTFPREQRTEAEAFSRDADWMSSVVLVAKSVHVWLDQLSRQNHREIRCLDQIPDRELDRLAHWGFNALWLIGLWRRSPASERIKRRMGNPEAVASAYSLADYVVADDLGGDGALAELEGRCRQRGIRLACDVVPNHTGIDSRWVRQHPDWFIQVAHPPYPAYRFLGPDLSSDPAIELRIEDGYWDHSDAAVVFERRDRASGEIRYLYHGNDGTHMPWNDTAQLNFLLPQVREAMIGTILQVARRFRIIRFDAAMTLAKRHFQRLWFPLPGGGAGVPSRAEHALSQDAFEAAFPVEFWREVVDRVAAEVPDTLLLAEAFWLMEGYFVRTLGMHRVYNSAFMNMLKQEDNAKYRSVLKNVLEFNPEILKRFVNFMNNPDEATAVEQFGKGDKYFGVAILLATLPGLPMFGHGQLEGLREKYGMEYRRAYWEETPDEGFIAHHERQVCPLLKRRSLFSEADAFELYDFETGGHVNQDVFAFSNGHGKERALVVYHNHPGETGGWLRRSVPKAVPGPGGELQPRTVSLAQGLGVEPGGAAFWRCREHRTGLERLFSTAELTAEGLHLQLGPYEYRVFLEIRPQDEEQTLWQDLYRRLEGRAVADLDRELGRLRWQDLHARLDQVLAPAVAAELAAELTRAGKSLRLAVPHLRRRLSLFLEDLGRATGGQQLAAAELAVFADLVALRRLCLLGSRSATERRRLGRLRRLALPGKARALAPEALALAILGRLGRLAGETAAAQRTSDWVERLQLADRADLPGVPRSGLWLRLVLRHRRAWSRPEGRNLASLLQDPEVVDYLGVHQAGGETWFNREASQALFQGLALAAALLLAREQPMQAQELRRQLVELEHHLETTLERATETGFRLEKFLAAG